MLFFLEIKELGGSVQKVMMNDMPQNVMDSEQLDNTKKKVPFQSFLEQIDNTGELLENSSTMDNIKRRRCIRADIATRSMDEMRYVKYSRARRVSFVNKNRYKFSEWVGLDGTIFGLILKLLCIYFNMIILIFIFCNLQVILLCQNKHMQF